MTADAIIKKLDLQPHPEGGYYRQTWIADNDGRPTGTCIYFLLKNGESSHWHRVDAAEFWLWHAGDPLPLSVAATDAGPTHIITLGPDILNDHQSQRVIEPGAWQAAGPANGPEGYTLVSCIVAPGFEFSGFHLAAPEWAPGGDK